MPLTAAAKAPSPPRRLPAETLLRTVVPGTRRSARLRRADRCERGLLAVQAPDQPVHCSRSSPAPRSGTGWRRTRHPSTPGHRMSRRGRPPCRLSDVIRRSPVPEQPDDLGAATIASLVGTTHQCEPGHRSTQCHEIAVPAAPATVAQCPGTTRSRLRRPRLGPRAKRELRRPRPPGRAAPLAPALRAPDASRSPPAFASAYVLVDRLLARARGPPARPARRSPQETTRASPPRSAEPLQ